MSDTQKTELNSHTENALALLKEKVEALLAANMAVVFTPAVAKEIVKSSPETFKNVDGEGITLIQETVLKAIVAGLKIQEDSKDAETVNVFVDTLVEEMADTSEVVEEGFSFVKTACIIGCALLAVGLAVRLWSAFTSSSSNSNMPVVSENFGAPGVAGVSQ